MQVKEYALYKGEELLAMGTKREIIEIIDIKYQSNVALAIYEHNFRRTYDTSALIIYKELD